MDGDHSRHRFREGQNLATNTNGLAQVWRCLPASKTVAATDTANPSPLYHGTRADLKPGDLIGPGYTSNYGPRKANHVYFSATLDAAVWGAELAAGSGPGRIYLVEPTGPFGDDPNLTDKKFPGNPTRSYRSKHPLRVVGEVKDWQGHPPERLEEMRAHLERLRQQGIEAVDD